MERRGHSGVVSHPVSAQPLRRSPMSHQINCMDFCKDKDVFGSFMEMRLGKTLSVIRSMQEKTDGPYLVLAPKSVVLTWCDELQLENALYRPVLGDRAARAQALSGPPNAWYVANYEALRAVPGLPRAQPWKAVICDESTAIKNPQAKRSKVIATQFAHVPYRAILSGLPAPESPMDYFMQMKFLLGEFMGHKNFWSWRKAYFHCDRRGWNWWPHLGTLAKIKAAVHEHCFILTRNQAGIGSRQIFQTRLIDMNAAQRKMIKGIKKNFEWTGTDDELHLSKYVPVNFTWISRLASGMTPDGKEIICNNKFNALMDIITQDFPGEKIIVWFRFNAEIKHMNHLLEKKGILTRCIMGATPVLYRHKYRIELNVGNTQVLLMQGMVGKFGLDCSGADVAVYFSNHDSSETREQTKDRIIHPHKKRPLLYIDLATKDSVDVERLESLRLKKSFSKIMMLNYFRS